MAHEAILIDTSVLIDHLRKSKKDETLLFRVLDRRNIWISVITEFELAVGVNEANREFIANLLAQISIFPLDSVCIQSAVTIYRSLKARNQLISLPDILIAATAVSNQLPLLTFNRKHFDRVAGLTALSEI